MLHLSSSPNGEAIPPAIPPDTYSLRIESHQSKFSLAEDGGCCDKLPMMSLTLKMRTLITSAGSMGTTITTTTMCASGAWRATGR